jgi:hypothetical protein
MKPELLYDPAKRAAFFASALVLILLSGCSSGSEPEVFCTTESRPAIVVNATDSVTKQPVYGFTGTVFRADGYRQTATAHPTINSMGFAFEGQDPVVGVYSVKVTKTGYQDWEAKDVVVTEDRCHVKTVSLDAMMVPL